MSRNEGRDADLAWLGDHRPLAELAYERFLKSGEWPLCDVAQRTLDAAGHDINVQRALTDLPKYVGEMRAYLPTSVQIPMRVLSHLPKARRLLRVCLCVLRHSRAVYRSGTGELTITDQDEDLRTIVGADHRLLPRAVQLLNSESVTPICGGLSGSGTWQFSFSPSQIRAVPELDKLSDFFDWQHRTAAEAASMRGMPLLPSLIESRSLSWSQPLDPATQDVDQLHPLVVHASGKLYRDGHFGPAIFEAFKTIEVRVRTATGLEQTGQSLMATALSESAPLIDVSTVPGVSGRDEQLGFKLIFMGAMTGIRNPKGHEAIVQTDPQRAWEYLALASLLMRRLDDADDAAGPVTALRGEARSIDVRRDRP